VIVGSTSSTDFPLVNPLISNTEKGAPAAFVVKTNPTTQQILFSTMLGGAAAETADPITRYGTHARAVAVDGSGNIYVGGDTNAPDFPVTPNAFQKSGQGGGSAFAIPYAFVTKFSPNGDKIVYSTVLGGSGAICTGFASPCIGKLGSNRITAIAVDGFGIATIAGYTNSP